MAATPSPKWQLTPAPWRPITHPRHSLVHCVRCHHAAVNESNGLHRDGWQETTVDRHRSYRCGLCSELDR